MLTDALDELQQGGLTHDIPWLMTEYGYSAFSTRAALDLDGALLNADSVGRFLTMGGEAAYLYGYEANAIIKEQSCSAGNNMLFFRDDRGRITTPTATYWGAHLLTQQWAQPGDQPHEIYPATSDVRNENGDHMLTAYAVHRPDGLWALLLLNRDPDRTLQTTVTFHNTASDTVGGFQGPLDLYQYSRQQYVLGGPPDQPFPVKSEAPVHTLLQASDPTATSVALPPYSLTVMRGKL